MRHPYQEFLPAIERPARYVGGEYLEVRKDPAAVEVLFALCFPDAYEVGMSHLGSKILYRLCNADPRIACERAFAPWPDLEAELRRRRLPLCSLESGRPLGAFDLVGFSLQFELTYSNLLAMLELGGLPLRSQQRGDQHPLVLAGGPNATHPEPLAPFIDLFFVGEAEEQLPALLVEAAALRRQRASRGERLRRLAARYPVYVPSLYGGTIDPVSGLVVVGEPVAPEVPPRVRRAVVADLDAFPFPDDAPVAVTEAVFDRAAVEIARGCTQGCRFCQAGMIYRPLRERAPAEVLATLLGSVHRGGYDETSLTALSTADYSCIGPLVEAAMVRLRQEKVSLSVSSLRAYGLPPALLDALAQVRTTSLTFAPEAGSQRLRDVINKNVCDEDLLSAAGAAFERGFGRLKLYFMIGLPTETDQDVLAIVDLAARVQAAGRRRLRGAEVTLSVSNHVPKPHTPFQFCAMDGDDELYRKQRLLREAAARRRLTVRWHDVEQSLVEGAFARGDRRLGEALLCAYRLGCRFDGWDDRFRGDLWRQAFAEAGVAPESYLGPLAPGGRLPWDHIEVGIDPGFLAREYRRAMRGRSSPPCGMSPARGEKAARATTLAGAGGVDDQDHGSSEVVVGAAEDGLKLICYGCGADCDLEDLRRRRACHLAQGNVLREESATTAAPAASDATAMPVAPAERVTATGPSVERPLAARRPMPTARFQQGEGWRVRLRFCKLGGAALLSHLDLLRLLPRIVRRAGLQMIYSQGFHPKPQIAFGPALAVGIEGLGEIIDIRLDGEEPDLVRLPARLSAAAPAGIAFDDARLLGVHDAALGRVLSGTDTLIALPEEEWSAEAEARRSSLGEAVVTRAERRQPQRVAGDGQPAAARQVPVARHLVSAELMPVTSLDPRLEWLDDPSPGRLILLLLRLRILGDGSLRASEVASLLLGREPRRPRYARLTLWALRGGRVLDPLDLESLRAASHGDSTPSSALRQAAKPPPAR